MYSMMSSYRNSVYLAYLTIFWMELYIFSALMKVKCTCYSLARLA